MNLLKFEDELATFQVERDGDTLLVMKGDEELQLPLGLSLLVEKSMRRRRITSAKFKAIRTGTGIHTYYTIVEVP